ncbi:hypothetical protein [Photobacterium kishitanii]|uniref:Uncharacterized protein n=1 Tax=Photobacterium kishitanii TaxID=318456 RepID=A0A2T3KLD2_9GAMM|nr:hypothetical protein [Photobacterium kishitanii]PSV00525.1 hypothetical protein C9J27_05165 [Photobacterium kishitanii]
MINNNDLQQFAMRKLKKASAVKYNGVLWITHENMPVGGGDYKNSLDSYSDILNYTVGLAMTWISGDMASLSASDIFDKFDAYPSVFENVEIKDDGTYTENRKSEPDLYPVAEAYISDDVRVLSYVYGIFAIVTKDKTIVFRCD